ncbi:hypothetical protein FH972_022261 [Carpinus fangiana]|uniref:acetyl-CoA C-acyltransferase n=1 Tax=Carpinus fangiana TaxID=176857 RepID=A0A5N6KS35_9ROSI|nr:hypothetical protein FH972_022261 [Carpinus fangiana]
MAHNFIAKGAKNVLQKQPHDVVILSALRTPSTRSYKGGLKDAYDHELLYHVLRATYAANPNLDPAKVQEITIGTVLSELGGSKAGRMAALHAGSSTLTPFSTMNRACASGLSAITHVAQAIAIGAIDVGIGGGMESMTRNYGSKAIPTQLWDGLRNSPDKDTRDCIMSMGITAENVAERYGVSREDQDAFAAASQQKAAAAQKNGLYPEIVPIKTRWTDPKDESKGPQELTVDKDDGIRLSTLEKLASMKPAFKPDGGSTAGNSSQISDGAAAALLMRRSTATELGLSSCIIGKWAGTQVVGCKPDEMGVGPAVAIPRLLEYTGVRKEEVGVWEINEAFASQALYSIRKLGLQQAYEDGKINPKGGAIALGHPLGATGARMLATLLPTLEMKGEEMGVLSACIGTGMGIASLIVRE